MSDLIKYRWNRLEFRVEVRGCQEGEIVCPGGVAVRRFGSITFHVFVLCAGKNFRQNVTRKNLVRADQESEIFS